MNRRVRHLNPVQAGAAYAFDSRFIAGVADNDPVSPWPTRAGGAEDAVATASAPLFKTGIQGGQPGVLFNGTNQGYLTSTDLPFPFTIMYVGQTPSLALSGRAIQSRDQNRIISYNMAIFSVYNDASVFEDSTVFPGGNAGVGVLTSGADSRWHIDSVLRGTVATVTNWGRLAMNGAGLVGQYVGCYKFMVAVFPVAITAAVRRRLEQSMSFSFRIPQL